MKIAYLKSKSWGFYVKVFLVMGLFFAQTGFPQAPAVQVCGTVTNTAGTGIYQSKVSFISQVNGDTTSTLTDTTGAYSVQLVLTETGVEEDQPQCPTGFQLHQNYPNPFNPRTHISFQLPKPAKVKITVYDLLGRQIKELTDSSYPAGKSEVYWDGTNGKNNLVSAGIYFYRIEAGQFNKTKKMVLLDGGGGRTIESTGNYSQKPLLKNNKTLVQKTFTIRAEKAGFFSFFEDDFAVTSEDTALEKNMVLSQYAICYNNVIDWGEPYSLDWEILITDINGDSVKNISNHPKEDDYSPAWSPDGRYVAYRRDKPIGGCDIYLYDILCDSRINLTYDLEGNESASQPEWTPDSEEIVYCHRINGINYTYIMNKDGSGKRKLLDFFDNRYMFFYSDSYHFIYMKNYRIYKTDIDGTSNEILVDLSTIGEHDVWLYDFNPNTEELLFLIAETPRITNILLVYSIQNQMMDTLSIADSIWIYLRPRYSTDYSKIAFIKANYTKNIFKIVLFENGIEKDLVYLTDKYEWVDYHPMVFSPKDNYIAYSKNMNQEGDLVWWKSYLHIVNINTNEIKFIDRDSAVDPQWNPLLPY